MQHGLPSICKPSFNKVRKYMQQFSLYIKSATRTDDALFFLFLFSFNLYAGKNKIATKLH